MFEGFSEAFNLNSIDENTSQANGGKLMNKQFLNLPPLPITKKGRNLIEECRP
jgi:hypothetical protein